MTYKPEMLKLHDRLGSMIDQVGQPDYSLRELVDGLRAVRDELFAQSEEAPAVAALTGETPRTDEAIKRGECGPDLARQLERELANANELCRRAGVDILEMEGRLKKAAPSSAVLTGETPRTDEALDHEVGTPDSLAVLSLARQLERELANANELAARLRAILRSNRHAPWLRREEYEAIQQAALTLARSESEHTNAAPQEVRSVRPTGNQISAPAVAAPRSDDKPLPAADVLALLLNAREHVCRIAEGKTKWRMSIPARPGEDSDLVIVEALEAAAAFIRTANSATWPTDEDIELMLDNAATASQVRDLLRTDDGEETVLREAVRRSVLQMLRRSDSAARNP